MILRSFEKHRCNVFYSKAEQSDLTYFDYMTCLMQFIIQCIKRVYSNSLRSQQQIAVLFPYNISYVLSISIGERSLLVMPLDFRNETPCGYENANDAECLMSIECNGSNGHSNVYIYL